MALIQIVDNAAEDFRIAAGKVQQHHAASTDDPKDEAILGNLVDVNPLPPMTCSTSPFLIFEDHRPYLIEHTSDATATMAPVAAAGGGQNRSGLSNGHFGMIAPSHSSVNLIERAKYLGGMQVVGDEGLRQWERQTPIYIPISPRDGESAKISKLSNRQPNRQSER